MQVLFYYSVSKPSCTIIFRDKELVSGKDWDDYTLLQAAAFEGQAEVVEYLLGLGADANEADQDGITALMKASIRGHFDVVKILVEAGESSYILITSLSRLHVKSLFLMVIPCAAYLINTIL